MSFREYLDSRRGEDSPVGGLARNLETAPYSEALRDLSDEAHADFLRHQKQKLNW